MAAVPAGGVVDDLPGVLPQPAGGQAGAGTFGVGVGVAGQHVLADHVLDEVQRPARRGVVGVGDAPRPVRAVEDLTLADDPGPDPLQQRRDRLRRGILRRDGGDWRRRLDVPGLALMTGR